RVFTRFARPGKQSLRGLRILRSDTDRRSMARFGNLFTKYLYSHARVEVIDEAERLEVRVHTPGREADFHVVADLARMPAPLPAGSTFRSMDDARAFAGPLPYTFSYDEATKRMVVVKGLRQAWDPKPVPVEVKEATYLDRAPFVGADIRLANAFFVSE